MESFRLLVNLTQPAMICFGNVPKGKMERHWFLEVISHLQSYKEVQYMHSAHKLCDTLYAVGNFNSEYKGASYDTEEYILEF